MAALMRPFLAIALSAMRIGVLLGRANEDALLSGLGDLEFVDARVAVAGGDERSCRGSSDASPTSTSKVPGPRAWGGGSGRCVVRLAPTPGSE